MRVKTGPVTRRRRKKVIKLAKGYYGAKHKLFKKSKEQVMKSMQNAYNDRKKRKSNFRKLWIIRINAELSKHNIKYSDFIYHLKKNKIIINRKMLSELAINDPDNFKKLLLSLKIDNKK